MREDLLHFIWKYKKLPLFDLITSDNEIVSIVNSGTYNTLSGPDFFNASLEIGGQLWVGNVEIHVNSSDWYVHRHEKDIKYDNVILHVVWEDDAVIFRKDGSKIPTLPLKNHISSNLLASYNKLSNKTNQTFISCEKEINKVDLFIIQNWLERVYIERLEKKSIFISELLTCSNNDWERVLYILLLKNFGSKVNGEAFLSLANNLNFQVIRKLRANPLQLESVLFGMCQLLSEEHFVDVYFQDLKSEYDYLKGKFGLNELGVIKPEFFRLRPPNFPTIRLSQFASLYLNTQNLFDKTISATTLNELYHLFDVAASEYWTTHYTFGKPSKKSIKKLSKKFIDLLIINTIVPLKFSYLKSLGKDDYEQIFQIIKEVKSENNSIISNFSSFGLATQTAKDSQAVIELYNQYCTKNRCLDCAVGSTLLGGND